MTKSDHNHSLTSNIKSLTITELNIYPVKSLAGISLQSSEMNIKGLKYDRHWMLVDENNSALTQRQIKFMANIRVELTDTDLILCVPNSDFSKLIISLDRPPTAEININIWEDSFVALLETTDRQGQNISQWFKTIMVHSLSARELKKYTEFKLVRMSDTITRPVDKRFLPNHLHSSHTQFCDGFPLLLTSEQSLLALNNDLRLNDAKYVDMSRFRANIVVSGFDHAWQENEIECLEYKSSLIYLCKPCQRCSMVTVNQNSTDENIEKKEPLKTLVNLTSTAFKPSNSRYKGIKGAYFGQNAVIDLNGNTDIRINVGDRLYFNAPK
jgi:uncharacterized protein